MPTLNGSAPAGVGTALSSKSRVWYQRGMIHAKIMTVDNLWSVAGSTKFDHPSFALTDEVNIAVMDRDLTAQLNGDFSGDLAGSIRADGLSPRKPLAT